MAPILPDKRFEPRGKTCFLKMTKCHTTVFASADNFAIAQPPHGVHEVNISILTLCLLDLITFVKLLHYKQKRSPEAGLAWLSV